MMCSSVSNKRGVIPWRDEVASPESITTIVRTDSGLALRAPGMTAEKSAYRVHTGSAGEYFTWLSAKLLSMEAMPSSRVSLVFRNAS
jgi:hypothetical protein